MELISIILPMYKRGRYTEFTLAHTEQITKNTDVEYVLVDDGNSEEYFDNFIKPFYTRNVGRCKLVRHDTNEGLRNSVIDGIKQCSGTYIQKLDNDFIISNEGWWKVGTDILKTGKVGLVVPMHLKDRNNYKNNIPNSHEPGFYICQFTGGNWLINRSAVSGKIFSKSTFSIPGMSLFSSSRLHLRDFGIVNLGETTKVWARHLGEPGYHTLEDANPLAIDTLEDHAAYYREVGRKGQ